MVSDRGQQLPECDHSDVWAGNHPLRPCLHPDCVARELAPGEVPPRPEQQLPERELLCMKITRLTADHRAWLYCQIPVGHAEPCRDREHGLPVCSFCGYEGRVPSSGRCSGCGLLPSTIAGPQERLPVSPDEGDTGAP